MSASGMNQNARQMNLSIIYLSKNLKRAESLYKISSWKHESSEVLRCTLRRLFRMNLSESFLKFGRRSKRWSSSCTGMCATYCTTSWSTISSGISMNVYQNVLIKCVSIKLVNRLVRFSRTKVYAALINA